MPPTTSLPFSTFALTSPSDTTPPPASTSFTLYPAPTHPTDIWRKPAGGSAAQVTSFNSPLIYKKIKWGQFLRARVTVKAVFERLYDQGGMVVVFPKDDPDGTKGTNKWIKTGIEFTHDEAFISTVGCDRFADWGLATRGIQTSPSNPKEKSVTLEMEWLGGDAALWIYAIVEDEGGKEKRLPVREVPWVLNPDVVTEDEELWIGVMACTPIIEGRDGSVDSGLVVGFEGWRLEIRE